MLISVVLSFYNEEDNIPELVRRLRAVFNDRIGCDYELIFVNDDSTDRSLELLLEERTKRPDIRIINMSRNFGVSECVMAGLHKARGDGVVYMDADLQDTPELIEEMVRLWKEDKKTEVVYTTRTGRPGEHPFKMLLTKLGYQILQSTAHIDIKPNSGDFKLLSRRVVNEIVKLNEKRPFVRGLTTWVGFQQKQLFYQREERHSGKTKFPIYSWRVISNFLDSALISFSDVPLKLAFFIGSLACLVALILTAGVVYQYFVRTTLPGWSTLMVTMLMLGGGQFMIMGVLGLYLNAVFQESKRRPNYIIKDLVGFE